MEIQDIKQQLTMTMVLHYYGARFYDAVLGRFAGVDPRAEKYSRWSSYNYVLGNPIKNVDPNGDTVRISIGNEQFINYTPGMEYKGDDKFVKNIVNTLNDITSVDAGKEVVNALSLSTNNFDILNQAPNNADAAAAFIPNQNGGGVVKVGKSNALGDVAHEIFHGYQKESGWNDLKITAAEVEAYLFEDVITTSLLITSGATMSEGNLGIQYDQSYQNLLYNGYNQIDYEIAVKNFKSSGRNLTGIYNNYTISIPKKPAIRKFIPVK